MNTFNEVDHELAILESIYHNSKDSSVKQRDLAQIVGISLGMTNVILKKLTQRGWVAVRKINNRNLQYAVTPSGIDEIVRRSFKFLKRTLRNVVYFKDVLEAFLVDVKAKGYIGITLVGKSDFDFILAHLCQKHSIQFHHLEKPIRREGILLVFGEDMGYSPAKSAETRGERTAFLHDILIGL